MRVAAAVVLTAMDEEAEPFLAEARSRKIPVGHVRTPGMFDAWFLNLSTPRLLLVKSGIGQTAAASAASWALGFVSTRDIIVSGSAGGLTGVNVGDVVVGTHYRYSEVDATAFDYEWGQVPGQPATFTGSPRVLDNYDAVAKQAEYPLARGLMVSSDSFITDNRYRDLVTRFPTALSTDMESVAVAQVAHSYGVGFTAVRAISDLCGPDAGADHSLGLDVAASRAAEVTLGLIGGFASGGRRRDIRRRTFSIEALTAALYAVVAIDHNLDPVDDPEFDDDLTELFRSMLPGHRAHFAGLIAAGKKYVEKHEDLRLTSQRYDRIRARILEDFNIRGGRGRQVWPPTSQTIMKRFDGLWNNALTAIGLKAATGRRPGGLRYTADDYRTAIRLYHEWAISQNRTPSYAGYQTWQKAQDTRYPSGASVRQHFVTWADAILSVYHS